MISKREKLDNPQSDNIQRLGHYIADTKNNGEKCMLVWSEGCFAGDDFELALDEIKATQACNRRTSKEKTYHLIVSFRPEDAPKLNEDKLREIEKSFAETLGFQHHERVCAVHTNTANLHMHVAYNMINPRTKARHDPGWDKIKRDKLCRQLEKEYGLAVDPGRDPNAQHPKLSQKSRTFETKTGLKSFESYVLERGATIREILENAENWQHLQKQLAWHGLTIRLRGNGCVLSAVDSPIKGNLHIKASSIGREFSRAALEKRFGNYQASTGKYDINERYDLAPAKALKTYQEKQAWRFYLREHNRLARQDKDLKQSFNNFKFQIIRFFEAGYEI